MAVFYGCPVAIFKAGGEVTVWEFIAIN